MAEAFRPGNQRSIAGNLVVLDGLRRSDNGRIQHIFVRDFTGQLDNRIFNDLRWVPLATLPTYDFLAADLGLIRDLSEGKLL